MTQATKQSVLLLHTGQPSFLPTWRELFAARVPGLEVRWIDDPGVDPEAVEYALVWSPPAGQLAQFPNLKCIISSGAGVDHLHSDPQLPPGVPIARMTSDGVNRRMAEYLLMSILGLSRDITRLVANHQAAKWDILEPEFSLADVTVGIMGVGTLGTYCANYLNAAGCRVVGWSRQRKELPGMRSFAGQDQLADFLACTNILVCLLPLTDKTRGILCETTFAQLPDGAYVINVGRGAHLVEQDLVRALAAGKLKGAVLDVFDPEPLPSSSPLWRCPGVFVTSHIAANAPPTDKADFTARVIAAARAGQPLPNLYRG